MMKILLAGQAFYRRDNGQAVFTVNLAEGLVKAGHDVVVFAPSLTGKAERKKVKGVQVVTVPTVHFRHNVNVSFFSACYVKDELVRFLPDIVHIQDHYFLSRTVLRHAQRMGMTVVGTNHFLPENLTDNARIPARVQPLANKFLWRTMLSVYNRLDAVTTPTKTAVSILKQQPLSPPAEAISCGIDKERFYPRPVADWQHIRAKYNLDADKAIVLYVGRVDREKDLDVVVRAMAQIKRDDVQFAIAGKGMFLDDLRRMCHELSVNDRVRLLGFVPDKDLPLLLNSVDAFVMPSHAELQSIATLEAMSCGLPVLAANARALPELVLPGINGYLFAVGDAQDVACGLKTFAAERPRWSEMGEASLRMAAPHSLAQTVQQYVGWYQRLLKRSLSPSPQPIWEGAKA